MDPFHDDLALFACISAERVILDAGFRPTEGGHVAPAQLKEERSSARGGRERRSTMRLFWSFSVVLLAGVLAGCASKKHDGRFTDFPEPRGTSGDVDLWDQPDAQGSRARRGDRDALQATFARALELKPEDAGSFQYDLRALRDALGDERFFAALAQESAEIQRRVAPFAPR